VGNGTTEAPQVPTRSIGALHGVGAGRTPRGRVRGGSARPMIATGLSAARIVCTPEAGPAMDAGIGPGIPRTPLQRATPEPPSVVLPGPCERSCGLACRPNALRRTSGWLAAPEGSHTSSALAGPPPGSRIESPEGGQQESERDLPRGVPLPSGGPGRLTSVNGGRR
jgi:hypothetical protein